MSRLSSPQPTDHSAVHRWVALHAATQTLSETPDLTAALPQVLDQVLREVLAQEGGWLMLLDQAGSALRLVASQGIETDALAHWQTVDVKTQRGHLAAQLEAPLLLDDLSPYPELTLLAAQGWEYYLGIPLSAGDRPLGLLVTLARGQCPLREEDKAFLRAVGQQIGMAVENARLKAAAEQSAHRCQELITNYPYALLFIDDELRIIHANPQAAELTGYTLGGLVGMDMRWLFPSEFHQELAALSSSNEAPPMRREVTLIAKDGQRLKVEITFAKTCKEWDGKQVACLCLRDLTPLKREERILRPLNAAALALQSAHTAEDVFTALSEQLSRAGLQTAIATLDKEGQHLTLKHLTPASEDQALDQELIGTQIPLKAIPTFEEVVSRGQARFVLSLQPDADLWPPASRVFGQEPCICAPLLIKDRVHGLLAVTAPFLTEADVQAVSSFAQQIAIALDNVQLYQAATRRAQELSTINDIGRAITSTLDLDSLLERTMEGVNQILNVEAGSVLLVDEETGDLVFRVSLQNDEWQRISNLRVPAGTGVVGAVVREGKPQIVPDVSRDPRFYSKVDSEMAFTTRSILCVPLIVRGQTIGAIEVLNKIGGQFTNEDLELLSSIAASVGVAIENATLYKAVQTHAEELEERVAERTRDLNLAIEELFERERAQREISEQLRKANREIEAILNSVADGLIVTDGHGYMRMANPRAEELLGFRLEDLQGKRIAEDEQTGCTLRLLARKIAQRTAQASTVEFEIPSPKQNLKTNCWEDFQCSRQECPAWGQASILCWLMPGTRCQETHLPQSEESPEIRCLACERYQRLEKLTLQAHSAPILSEDQQVMGTVTVLRDITRLRELDRLKSKFVSNVSHELRTPLTNIKMYISLLKHGKAEKRARYLEIIERESDRLRMLIEDVLSLSRLEARETPPQRTPVAISEIVESVLNI
ncbi:MAG: GAF domain-containing protein, partial [Anaerolineae bacterium]|nr:GAF domain-containing protein [Anaerolineae bacterium]